MDFLLTAFNMLSPMPTVTAVPANVPPPQPAREAPFNWTPIVAIGVVTLLGTALMIETKGKI